MSNWVEVKQSYRELPTRGKVLLWLIVSILSIAAIEGAALIVWQIMRWL